MTQATVQQAAPRALTGNQLYDILDLILDRGLVIDVFARVKLVGIELLTIDVRVVVASVDTYLRFAAACNRLDLSATSGKGLEGLGDTLGGATGAIGGATSGATGALGDVTGAAGEVASTGQQAATAATGTAGAAKAAAPSTGAGGTQARGTAKRTASRK